MAQIQKQPPRDLPASFGRYQLVKLLGRGGMGSVFLAQDTQLDRPVALKIPLLDGADAAHVLTRFYREARAAAALHHPNICPIHDVGECDGLPYLTMAYIQGKLLSEFVKLRPLLPRQSAILVRKLALALQEAHKGNIIHRDLKPANIMIDARGEPIIMDFGLARHVRAGAGDAQITQQGVVIGTPAYMPPEQVSGNVAEMGPACDIYSLGVILYELLSGRLPFSGDVLSMLLRAATEEPSPPSQFRPDLEPELEAICLKAMAKKADARYRSMAELAASTSESGERS
jgi:eukaryotic-like serine/threonine-protein kinase